MVCPERGWQLDDNIVDRISLQYPFKGEKPRRCGRPPVKRGCINVTLPNSKGVRSCGLLKNKPTWQIRLWECQGTYNFMLFLFFTFWFPSCFVLFGSITLIYFPSLYSSLGVVSVYGPTFCRLFAKRGMLGVLGTTSSSRRQRRPGRRRSATPVPLALFAML